MIWAYLVCSGTSVKTANVVTDGDEARVVSVQVGFLSILVWLSLAVLVQKPAVT